MALGLSSTQLPERRRRPRRDVDHQRLAGDGGVAVVHRQVLQPRARAEDSWCRCRIGLQRAWAGCNLRNTGPKSLLQLINMGRNQVTWLGLGPQVLAILSPLGPPLHYGKSATIPRALHAEASAFQSFASPTRSQKP
ncbi:hypothetical protein [Oryza sativa Japonica Group]|uniref:Uncharacterized protein OSJNBb0024F06.4 n=1 Tax=Oryza sativa subsp. japonica TaxID=39947 RepID=Q5ZB12_ORYSJ|nr:hypothetical protein [Oryza sativa Japonica Group]